MTTKQRDPKPAIGGKDRSMQTLFRLDGRTIIITGGGGSVGLEAASAILESGAGVICLDRQLLKDLWGLSPFPSI
ncbi:hypothetical protein DPV78_007020 [Talaromyces pinophilus]|nr:hypothetical protein DPV78_007020 [Talaromyces pinophilus]